MGSYSWAELLGRRPILPAITTRRNSQDGRALEFYHSVVAPAFSQFPGDDFWTRLVAQASLQEPAVRHAVVAISSMYELIEPDQPSDGFLATQRGRYALLQYNQSLQQLTQTRDESVVLFVCVLFICIEALRGNKQGALTHCRHGIRVLNNLTANGQSWVADYFRPIFVRLAGCPFFISPSARGIPLPLGADVEDTPGPPRSYEDLRYRIKLLAAAVVRFVNEYDLQPPDKPGPPPDYTMFFNRQTHILSKTQQWLRDFDVLVVSNPPPETCISPYLQLKMTAHSITVWVSSFGSESENVYAAHEETFRKIVDTAQEIRAHRDRFFDSGSKTQPRPIPKFIPELAFVPSLFLTATKCRNLAIRQAAVECMEALAPGRENIWQTPVLCEVARRIIEVEHPEIRGGIAHATSSETVVGVELVGGGSGSLNNVACRLLSHPETYNTAAVNGGRIALCTTACSSELKISNLSISIGKCRATPATDESIPVDPALCGSVPDVTESPILRMMPIRGKPKTETPTEDNGN